MTDQSNRLTKSKGFTIADVIKLSWRYYKSTDGDNKDKRMKLDVISAKIVVRQNYEYDKTTQLWSQTGRNVKLVFMVKSNPISYKKTDTIKNHIYPVTFLIHDIESGINSTFKFRTGSLKKPIFKKPGMTSEKIANTNVRNQIQLNFFFYLEFILKKHNLLFGRCWANKPPINVNPKGYIFFDKTSWFVIKKFLIRILGTNGGIVKSTLIRNEKI